MINIDAIKKQYPLELWAQNPVLRSIAAPVEKITDEMREFGMCLLELMYAYDWVWLAAPQVWQLIRMAAFTQYSFGEKRIKQTLEDVMINPVILSQASTNDIDVEWCLSLPWVEWSVERPSSIVVEYTTLHGKKTMLKASWYNARIILHEIDHLDGVLFVDKLV